MLISRRSFLSAAVAGSTAASLGQLALSHPAPIAKQQLKLGLVTYNWGKDWDVPTIIKNCSKTGFTGVELRSTHKHGVEPGISAAQRKEVHRQFADSNVTLVGLGSACEFHSPDPAVLKKNIDETREFIKLCSEVGGSGVKVRPNGLPAGVPVDKTIEQIGRSLNEVGRFANDHGVQIRVEVHGNRTAEIPIMQKIMQIADHSNVVICWNCNPNDLEGAGFERNFDSLQHRLGTVHIHDLRKDNYPWQDLFRSLKTVDNPGFTGWTLLEDGNVPDDILAAMKENHQVWESLVNEHRS